MGWRAITFEQNAEQFVCHFWRFEPLFVFSTNPEPPTSDSPSPTLTEHERIVGKGIGQITCRRKEKKL
jgi:hypothetical protein